MYTDECMYTCMCMDASMDRWIGEWLDAWMDVRVYGYNFPRTYACLYTSCIYMSCSTCACMKGPRDILAVESLHNK